jgi:hypothetical protein
MLRPMIENMQNGVRGGSGPVNPFGTNFQGNSFHPAPAQNTPALVDNPSSLAPPCSDAAGIAAAAAVCAAECRKTIKNEEIGFLDASTYLPQEVFISGPLKSQNKDTGLLKKVTDKFRLTKHVDADGVTKNIMSCEELATLQLMVECLYGKPAEGSVCFPEATYTLLMRMVAEHPSMQCSCFYVLQLMLLVDADIDRCFLLRTVQAVAGLLDPQVTLTYEISGPARFLAVCLISVYFCRGPKISTCPKLLVPMLNVVLDVCTFYISKDYTDQSYRPELRQWTASLLHNLLLFQLKAGGWNTTDEIHPHLVQMLCGVIEDIADEADCVVLHRRLSVAHNIVLNFPATRELFKDLGFMDTYRELKIHRSSALNVLASAVDGTLQLVQG